MPSLKKALLGRPRDFRDPKIFHRISLVAILAWVGLGADGLSSSSYGPEAAFQALAGHEYLAFYLAVVMACTVFIISYSYSRIIEAFPTGGGGYVVATKLLGKGAGVTSGAALLVDYVLTITTSVAGGVDALFSLASPEWQSLRLPAEILVLFGLVWLNLRGVKESVTTLSPIFFAFLLSHAILIGGALMLGASHISSLHRDITVGTHTDMHNLGLVALLLLFFRAYSLGGGTYTGIEAVSNGLPMMRQPRVETGKKTMLYMACSLAITAAGILVCYYLLGIRPVLGKTMNAVLAEHFAFSGYFGPHLVGATFVAIVLLSEALLLFVAAQSGFLDGPRVMANMAVDSWFPHRFSALSERLTMENGVLLMGGAALATLIYTRGNIGTLLVMYSINVFLTFSLSQLAMIKYWLEKRKLHEHWRRHVPVHLVGFVLCAGILCVTIYEKFTEGGWVTLAMTTVVIAACVLVRGHYLSLKKHTAQLDEILQNFPADAPKEIRPVRQGAPTAVLLVSGYNGLGIHSLLSLLRLFPGHFANVVFVSVGVLDSANFKGAEETESLRTQVDGDLQRYVELAQRLGLAAVARSTLGTEVVEASEELCREVVKEFPNAIIFASKVIFRRETALQGLLHNETAYAIQRRLQFSGFQTVVLPVRISA